MFEKRKVMASGRQFHNLAVLGKNGDSKTPTGTTGSERHLIEMARCLCPRMSTKNDGEGYNSRQLCGAEAVVVTIEKREKQLHDDGTATACWK